MRSYLFACKVMHQRLYPKRHRFAYGTLMAYLDLDELPELSAKIKGFQFNQPGPFSFYEADHLKVEDAELRALPLKERVHRILAQQFGMDLPAEGRVTLLTNLRTLGYVFNPVSFFYCWGEPSPGPSDHPPPQGEGHTKDVPVCVMVQVGNTFNEQKLYLIPLSLSRPTATLSHGERGDLNDPLSSLKREESSPEIPPPQGEGGRRPGEGKIFYRSQPIKEFYVSPFGELQDHFDFKISLPDATPGENSHPRQLAIFVDTVRFPSSSPSIGPSNPTLPQGEGKDLQVVLTTSLHGQAMPMNGWGLIKMGLRYPLSTLMVIARIHYQALLLFMKGLPFFKKDFDPSHQTQVLNAHHSLKKHL